MKDEQMDFEAKMEKKFDLSDNATQELGQLKEKIAGKDEAINALSKSLMEKAAEHEKMSEMFMQFKNKLIYENCFHV